MKEIVKRYFIDENRNCAEAVLLSANEKYNLESSKDVVKAIGAFGGGMFSERLCGGIAGAVAAIGLKYSQEEARTSHEMQIRINEFIMEFNNKYESDQCSYLKPKYRDEHIRCLDLIIDIVVILEKHM